MEKNTYIRFDWGIKRLLRDKANLNHRDMGMQVHSDLGR